jgi:hypothetical protein
LVSCVVNFDRGGCWLFSRPIACVVIAWNNASVSETVVVHNVINVFASSSALLLRYSDDGVDFLQIGFSGLLPALAAPDNMLGGMAYCAALANICGCTTRVNEAVSSSGGAGD